MTQQSFFIRSHFIHRKKRKKCDKSSYAPIYPQYPQLWTDFLVENTENFDFLRNNYKMQTVEIGTIKKNGEDGLPIPPYAVYNIGNNQPENLLDFVQILQEELINAGVLPEDYDFDAHKELVPMQPGDVDKTYADITKAKALINYEPSISFEDGIKKFIEWYKGENK